VAQKQPMKLAAMEGLYQGKVKAGLVAFGVLNPAKEAYNDATDPFLFKIELPGMLSFFDARDLTSFVPGVKDLVDGYTTSAGVKEPSVAEKIEKGKLAITSLAEYRKAKTANDAAAMQQHRSTLESNFKYFGYGYMDKPTDAIPPIGVTFYAFHIMVILGCAFILLFIITTVVSHKKTFEGKRWLQWVCLWSIPLVYIASQAGWLVAEFGRQPWTIQDLLPTWAAVSDLSSGSVMLTFFLFLILFAIMLAAEINIMLKAIKKGPETVIENN
jgi:cytochrome d ubiquinol oxidase subunit I